MSTVKALVVPVEGSADVRKIRPDLATLEAIVGGYIEGVSSGIDSEWHAYREEKGKVKSYPPNARATALAWELGWPLGDVLAGDVVFLGNDPDDSAEEGDVPPFVLDTWTRVDGLFGRIEEP